MIQELFDKIISDDLSVWFVDIWKRFSLKYFDHVWLNIDDNMNRLLIDIIFRLITSESISNEIRACIKKNKNMRERKKKKKIIYEEDYCTNITIFFSPAVTWKDFYSYSHFSFYWHHHNWFFCAGNNVQHNITLGQPEIKWHAIKMATYGLRKKQDLSCPMPVNRHVRPSYCLYSIIFSSLPIGILYIYCSRARTQKEWRKIELFFIDSNRLLWNLRNSFTYLMFLSVLFHFRSLRIKTSSIMEIRLIVVYTRPEIPSFAFFLSIYSSFSNYSFVDVCC